MSESRISALEAGNWWRKNERLGTLLNRLMLLFVLVPIGLVFNRYYILSFVIFALMVPYGFLLRFLAVRAVRQHLENHPEESEEFEQAGIIIFSRPSA